MWRVVSFIIHTLDELGMLCCKLIGLKAEDPFQKISSPRLKKSNQKKG